tara:strand:+ start:3880 stop:4722 length:843 start_codon:yes stop_codon:yes gene_type:complete
MNIFLTGASGFIGSKLLSDANFLKKFKKIYCLTRRKNKTNSKNIIWVNGDLSTNLTKYFKKSNYLIHLAAHSANKPYDNLQNCLIWNCINSIKLINSAYSAGINKFIVLGTFYEFGLSGNIYKNKGIPAIAPQLPQSTYATSKAFFFQNLLNWSMDKNIGIRYLRLPHIYGQGEKKTRLWPIIKTNKKNKILLDNPDFRSTFLSINNLIPQIIKFSNFQNLKKKCFEINNLPGQNLSIYNFAKIQKKITGSSIKIIKKNNKNTDWKFLIMKKQKKIIKLK